MAMSCVADNTATQAAAAKAASGAAAGLDIASRTAPKPSAGWISSNQPRRRPKRCRARSGGGWSSIGAQRNFNEYASPIQAVSPTMANPEPLSDNHSRKVNPDSGNGRPETNPYAAIAARRRSMRIRPDG